MRTRSSDCRGKPRSGMKLAMVLYGQHRARTRHPGAAHQERLHREAALGRRRQLPRQPLVASDRPGAGCALRIDPLAINIGGQRRCTAADQAQTSAEQPGLQATEPVLHRRCGAHTTSLSGRAWRVSRPPPPASGLHIFPGPGPQSTPARLTAAANSGRRYTVAAPHNGTSLPLRGVPPAAGSCAPLPC
jgi:hypothetical protein